MLLCESTFLYAYVAIHHHSVLAVHAFQGFFNRDSSRIENAQIYAHKRCPSVIRDVLAECAMEAHPQLKQYQTTAT